MSNALGYPEYQIQGNGITLSINAGIPDAQGSYWWLEDLDGWDSPDVRGTTLAKISESGERASDLHYRGRSLVFRNGWCESPSESARQHSRDILAAVTDLVDTATGLVVVNEVVPKQLVVSRFGNTGQGKMTANYNRRGIKPGDGELPALPAGMAYLLKWQAELYAEDPVKYAVTQQSLLMTTGSITATNQGNRPTYPVMTVTTGGHDPIVIANTTTGASLELHVPVIPVPPGPLPAMPSSLTVDFYNKSIVDGSSNPRNDIRDLATTFFALVPGPNALTVIPSSVAVAILFRDAYI